MWGSGDTGMAAVGIAVTAAAGMAAVAAGIMAARMVLMVASRGRCQRRARPFQ